MFISLLGSVCGSVVSYYQQHSKVLTEGENIAYLKVDVYSFRGLYVSENSAL